MKTDIWRTQSTSPNQCPLCNKQLKEGSKTCFSCGFSIEPPPGSSVWIDPTVYHFQPSDASQARKSSGTISGLSRSSPRSKKQTNPLTPIPPRASAQRSGGMKALPDARPSRQQSTPQIRQSRSTIPLGRREISTPKPSQPIIWQYESRNFEAGSSLPSLSLLVPELPTEPGLFPDQIEEQSPVPPTSQHLSHVDEIDTLPAHLVAPKMLQRDTSSARPVDEIDTQPNLQEASHRQLPVPAAMAVIPLPQKQQVVEIGSMPSQSWTAGGSTESYYAQYIASRGGKRQHQGLSLNPIDRTRWWLLRPGRLEFIMWLGGTILLITVTCVLLLVSALSLNWITPNSQGNMTTNPSTSSLRTHPLPTVTTTPGLVLKLLDKGPLLPGQSFRVYGEGFSLRSRIAFTFDGMQPLLNSNGQPSTTMTDARGAFTFTIHIGDGSQWAPGEHLLIARDIAANRVAALYFTIAPIPFGKAVTPTTSSKNAPAPGSGGGPGGVTATPTQTQGNPGSTPTPIPTAVNQTPVVPSPTPTHGITPTPTSPPPTPTPTSPPPTPTPTHGVTPTITPSPTASASVETPTASPTSSSSNPLLSNALSDEPALKTPLANLSPLVWLMIACYSVGMLLLGIAGVLHKRRK